MAATIGNIKIELLARLEGAEPIAIGTVDVPVELSAEGLVIAAPAAIRAEFTKLIEDEFSGMAEHLNSGQHA